MALRAMNTLVAIKIETVENVFQDDLDPAVDGVLCEVPDIGLDPQMTQTNEATGSLDGTAPIPGGVRAPISFATYGRSSGVPGTAPAIDAAIRACAHARTITMTEIAVATLSITGTNTIEDSADGLGALTVGTPIYLIDPNNAVNNQELIVATSAVGALGVTKINGDAPGLTNVAEASDIAVRYGVPAVAATAGSAFTATAQAPWDGTAQLYRFMPVLLSANPATPDFSFIMDYTAGRVATLVDSYGAPLSGTTKMGIPAHILYVPASAGIPSLSIAIYRDGTLWKFKGCRGKLTQEYNAAGAVMMRFAMTGTFVSKTDVAMPANDLELTSPGIFLKSRFLIERAKVALAKFTVDPDQALDYPPNPNEDEGYDATIHGRRRAQGTMDPNDVLVATRNAIADLKAGSARSIHARVTGGAAAVAGRRIGLTVPRAKYISLKPGARGEIATETMGWFGEGSNSGYGLAFY